MMNAVARMEVAAERAQDAANRMEIEGGENGMRKPTQRRKDEGTRGNKIFKLAPLRLRARSSDFQDLLGFALIFALAWIAWVVL
jgi:hypothetical protein